MIHWALQFAKAMVRARPQGTPMDWKPAKIVSSTIGESVVTFDGGRTQVQAFNCDHTKSLLAGTRVMVMVHGNKRWVVGVNPS